MLRKIILAILTIALYFSPFRVYAEQNFDISEHEDLFSMPFEKLMQLEIESSDKQSTPVEDIPASVTIITRSQIEKSGYQTFGEIIRNIPGLYLLDNTESLFIGIRGTAGGGVQMLINGIPWHPSLQKGLQSTDISQFNISVESIDRIEVIRGPMSVIYGNNAFLGMINLITNDIDRQKTQFSVAYGTRNSARVSARYGKHFRDGYLLLNTGGLKSDGLDGAYKDMLSTEQLAELHPDAKTCMDGDFDHLHGNIDLYTQYKKFNTYFRYSDMDYGFYPTSAGFGGDNRIKLKTWQVSLAYETTYHNHTRLKSTLITSNELYRIPQFSFLTPQTTGNQEQNSRRIEFEVNVSHDLDKIQIINGYRYRLIDDLYNHVNITLAPGEKPILGSFRDINDIPTHEIFSQLSYKFIPTWDLVLGLRYLRLPNQYEAHELDTFTNETTTRVTRIPEQDQFTGRIALLKNLSSHNILKLMAGTAAQDRDQIEISEPEYITTYEINFLTTFSDFKSNISIFQNDIKHIVQRSAVFDVDKNTYMNRIDNTGQWETRGIELSAQARLLNNWHFNGSLTVQETRDHLNHISVGYSPNLLVKFKVYYENGPFNLALLSRYVDKMSAGYHLLDHDNDPSTPPEIERIGDSVQGYYIMDANVRYNMTNGLYMSINVSNLLGQEIRYPANELTEMQKGLIGQGRIMMASVGYNFGGNEK